MGFVNRYLLSTALKVVHLLVRVVQTQRGELLTNELLTKPPLSMQTTALERITLVTLIRG